MAQRLRAEVTPVAVRLVIPPLAPSVSEHDARAVTALLRFQRESAPLVPTTMPLLERWLIEFSSHKGGSQR